MVWWSVDPGVGTGVAVWEDDLLVWAGVLSNTTTRKAGEAYAAALEEARDLLARYPAALVVLELPQVYGVRATRVADLVYLAAYAGEFAASCAPAARVYVEPADWKGQAPKDVVHRRIGKVLRPSELAALGACLPSLRHNMLDAVGIGLARLGRLPGGRWAPRAD